jgi:esterase/lipase superfamily enzyme
MGSARPRFALFLSQDDHALKISRSIWGGATRLGDINPDEEPYKSDLDREKVLTFDVTHLEGNSHSRAFDDVTSVMGMIERRLAAGQQILEGHIRSNNVPRLDRKGRTGRYSEIAIRVDEVGTDFSKFGSC